MRPYDMDWGEILNSWGVGDLLYLRAIIDEKLAQSSRRKTIIRRGGP